jgi:hypothetical protein
MDNIEKSLIETIAKSDLSSIVSDAAELGLDSILDDGVLKDIPVLSTIIGLVKTGGAIKDYLYLKKIYRFLGALKDVPASERQELINKLGSDENERAKAGENILLIIDRLDNVNKPEILGYMFRDYLIGKISKTNFMLLTKSLELFNLELTANIKSYYEGPYNKELSSNDALQSLATSGLVGMYFGSGAINSGGGGYRKNELGAVFIEYL